MPSSGSSGEASSIGYVYVFCSNPFNSDGNIVSWTFAARRQQQNLQATVRSFPQLLILKPQLSTQSNHPCDATVFNKTSMTMIQSPPPILLERLNMYQVNFSLSYESGDVLGVYQPPCESATLCMGFIENNRAALRLEAELSSGQFTIQNSETIRIQPLMTLSTMTTTVEPAPSQLPSLPPSQSSISPTPTRDRAQPPPTQNQSMSHAQFKDSTDI